MRALLVVDIDSANGWERLSCIYPPDSRRVALSIKDTLREARSQGILIAFAVYPESKKFSGQEAQISKTPQETCFVCDLDDVRLAPFLEHRHDRFEPVFIKKAGDALSNKRLPEHLSALGVREVMLAGCFTFGCIHNTAQGAMEKGFSVTLLDKCVYPPFTDKHDKERWVREIEHTVPAHFRNTVFVRTWSAGRKTLGERLRHFARNLIQASHR